MSYPVNLVPADRDAGDSTSLTTLLETVFSSSRTAAFFSNLTSPGAHTVYITKGALVNDRSVFTTVASAQDILDNQIASEQIADLVSNPNKYRILNLSADSENYAFGISGYRHLVPSEQTLVHELMHALAIPSVIGLPGADLITEKSFFEQIAVFAGNAVFGSVRPFEIQGHISANGIGSVSQYTNSASAFQTSYVDGNEQISFAWSMRNQYSAEFTTVDSRGSTVRTYWRGAALDGDQVSNYITSERTLNGSNAMFEQRSNGFGFYVDPKTAAIIDGSIVDGGIASAQRAYDFARNMHFALTDGRSGLNTALAGFGGSFTLTQKFAGLEYAQNRTVTIAAERFENAGGIDWNGPVSSSGTPLDVFHLSDVASTRGAYLLGGSGYERFGIDLSDGSDRIHGGSGSDVIAVGTGSGANMAWGGAGDDVMVANQGKDFLFGEGDDDVFVGLGHGATINGGDGFDLTSYTDSISAILVESGTVETLFGIDHFTDIEAIVGSSQDDIFRSDGGMMYFGGAGKDEFHLKDGDIASGGEGADKFYIDTSQGGNIAILDFRSSDQLFVDGVAYTGIRLDGSWYRETMSDGSIRTVQVMEKISSFDHLIENRDVWKINADGSIKETFNSPFTVYDDMDPGKSDSFVWSGDKGMITFENGSTTTHLVLNKPTGPSLGLSFGWLSQTQFSLWADEVTGVYPNIYSHDGYYQGLLDHAALIPQVMSQFDVLM
ncbi:calcium-binding protein [Sphingomonas sp. CFBP 8760]|uniref:calcium-binding protein n=1 Tax=Sphingomonas sp. CFBP 8760 TaxID=2775282 RepID=UPI00177E97A8|nr:calcium-binding protein [Sphingomonas sp. CFBP 8760]MBD8546027.1 calcium-binding protein [Sphingomonas sp. CFBP 8760]